jgi:glycosyltransferase involved in cell wall biosynthesis
MDRLLTGSALHRDLSQRARARGSHFRWDACARQSIDFFSELS